MIDQNFSLRASAQYDLGFKDDWEGLVNGKRKDQALRFALGINFILETNKNTNYENFN
jgi:curli production assembly/transport component CsgG